MGCPGKWKHGPTPAVCPCLILSHDLLGRAISIESQAIPSPRVRACEVLVGGGGFGQIWGPAHLPRTNNRLSCCPSCKCRASTHVGFSFFSGRLGWHAPFASKGTGCWTGNLWNRKESTPDLLSGSWGVFLSGGITDIDDVSFFQFLLAHERETSIWKSLVFSFLGFLFFGGLLFFLLVLSGGASLENTHKSSSPAPKQIMRKEENLVGRPSSQLLLPPSSCGTLWSCP